MDKLKMHSINKVDDNIEKIGNLFPNCVTEAKRNGKITRVVDFDKLKQELSDFVGEGLTVEFKQSRNKLNRDVFETATVVICFWGVMIRVGLLGSNPLPLKS